MRRDGRQNSGMDNTLLITMTQQMALRRQMDVAANNIANMSTAGFKAETLLFEPDTARPARADERPRDIKFVRDWTVLRDMGQGQLQRTGDAFDLAMDGDGFFTVEGPEGPLYTRDGQFSLNPTGELVTRDGRRVLSQAGGPIQIAQGGDPPVIGEDGTIRQGQTVVGQIAAVSFARPGALEKIGDNLWAPRDQAPGPLIEGRIRQGMVEGSNVVAVRELTRIMEISRAYDSATRLQRQAEELRGRAIERLGRANG
jgi:flagellar basal-body rod protein FlgF